MNHQDNQQKNLQNSLSQAQKRYFNIGGILTVAFSNQTQLQMNITSGTVQSFELIFEISFKEAFFNFKNFNDKFNILPHVSSDINYRDNLFTSNLTIMESRINKVIELLKSLKEINPQIEQQVAKTLQDLKEILYFLRN